MNAQNLKPFLALGLALALGACASVPDRLVERSASPSERFVRIHPGLTQGEVRALAGEPATMTGATPAGEALWAYSYTDNWGYPSEFDVAFNARGIVASTSSGRLDY
ncbi:MAG TPA: hypothetical protein VN878_02130 [Usitatibacter sp.]|nr:hypothetical protein [Usitatibacter sp.]